MNHLVFAFYGFTLIFGIAVAVRIFTQRSAMRAYRENLLINGLMGVFLLWGTGCLYVAANINTELDVVRVFVSGAFIMVGLFIFCLPKHHHALFALGPLPVVFSWLAFLGPVAAVLVWVLGERYRYFPLIVPLVSLIAAVVYSQQLFRQHGQTVFYSPIVKTLSILLPVLFIAMAVTEGLVFGEFVMARGVTLSLPIIYLLNSAVMWVYRNELFPIPETDSFDGSMHIDSLTDKEQLVARAVCRGLSNKQVAAELCMSPSTVKNHLYSTYKKLKITNRVALIRYVKAL